MILNGSCSPKARFKTTVVWAAMLAFLLTSGLVRRASAQTAPTGQDAKQDEAKKTPDAAQPAAPVEGFKYGVYDGHAEFEVGYRYVDQVAGTQDAYKSMINLGEGAQLLHSSLSLRSNYGAGTFFDRLDFSMDNWGNDPYSSLRLNFSKSDKYEFTASYRGMNYYNFLSTWANPLLSSGNLFGQHSLDVNYRVTDVEFKLFPSSVLRPFVGYSRSTGTGPGFTTYSLTGNEFLLGTNWDYTSDEFFGGVEIALPKLNLTVQQGQRFVRNDTGVTSVVDSAGNVSRPFIGNTITLDSIGRGYHDRATLPSTKLFLKYSPFQNLKVTGRYIYSSIDIESVLNEVRTGNLVSLDSQLIYAAASDVNATQAKLPDHHGAFAVEYSPFSRLLLVDRFDNVSSHLSGSAILTSVFYNARPLSGAPQTSYTSTVTDLAASFLELNKVRNEFSAEVDLSHGFSLRGGERFTWTEAKLIDSENSGRPDERDASVTQNTGIFGLAFRPGRWMRVSLDYETTQASGVMTRTDPLNFDQLRFDWRVSPLKNLTLGGRVGLVNNSNYHTDIDLKGHNRDYSFDVSYEPSSRLSLNLDYTRTSILSDLAILLPQTLDLARSVYDERGSSTGGSLGIDIYRGIRSDVGLRAILNAGDLPFNYYQPFASLTIPIPRTGVAFKTYWQNFGYNEKNSDILDHRTHLFTFSLAFSR